MNYKDWCLEQIKLNKPYIEPAPIMDCVCDNCDKYGRPHTYSPKSTRWAFYNPVTHEIIEEDFKLLTI